MITFLKTAAVVACLICLIPLAVWAGTGNGRHAMHALRQFLVAMSCIVIPSVALSLIAVLID